MKSNIKEDPISTSAAPHHIVYFFIYSVFKYLVYYILKYQYISIYIKYVELRFILRFRYVQVLHGIHLKP